MFILLPGATLNLIELFFKSKEIYLSFCFCSLFLQVVKNKTNNMGSSDESDLETALTTTPPELLNATQLLNDDLLPAKSKEKYNTTYENFLKWKKDKKASSFSETVLLEYFNELAVKYKAGSLWAIYSMLKTTLKVKNCVNIDQYLKLKAFLKRKAEGYVPKKSKMLSGGNVEKFINEAPDDIYLATKVALILGVTGGLRSQELCDITVDDIENHGEMLLVKIHNTKNMIPRSFVVSGNYYEVVRKYQSLRSTKATSNRFFQQFRNGKCITQVIGKNKFGSMPKEIAQYLNLPNASLYTGHSFRRTSGTLLADSGLGISKLKKRGGWISSTVTEGCIDDSITIKIDVSNKIRESIQLSHNIMPEPEVPIASCSSNPAQKILKEDQKSVSPTASENRHISQIINQDQTPPSDQELVQATQNVTNSIQTIKYPGRNMTFSFSNNSNCTITLNINK